MLDPIHSSDPSRAAQTFQSHQANKPSAFKSLSKMGLRMWLGLAMLVLLTVGGVAAAYLATTRQDLRQQAASLYPGEGSDCTGFAKEGQAYCSNTTLGSCLTCKSGKGAHVDDTACLGLPCGTDSIHNDPGKQSCGGGVSKVGQVACSDSGQIVGNCKKCEWDAGARIARYVDADPSECFKENLVCGIQPTVAPTAKPTLKPTTAPTLKPGCNLIAGQEVCFGTSPVPTVSQSPLAGITGGAGGGMGGRSTTPKPTVSPTKAVLVTPQPTYEPNCLYIDGKKIYCSSFPGLGGPSITPKITPKTTPTLASGQLCVTIDGKKTCYGSTPAPTASRTPTSLPKASPTAGGMCNSNVSCPNNLTCVGGKCVDSSKSSCGLFKGCGDGYKCSGIFSGVCESIQPSPTKPAPTAVPAAVTTSNSGAACSLFSWCEEGFHCSSLLGGVCTPDAAPGTMCNSNVPCADGLSCVGGTCVLKNPTPTKTANIPTGVTAGVPSQLPSRVPTGRFCSGSTAACPVGQYCVGGNCILTNPASIVSSCQPNSACTNEGGFCNGEQNKKYQCINGKTTVALGGVPVDFIGECSQEQMNSVVKNLTTAKVLLDGVDELEVKCYETISIPDAEPFAEINTCGYASSLNAVLNTNIIHIACHDSETVIHEMAHLWANNTNNNSSSSNESFNRVLGCKNTGTNESISTKEQPNTEYGNTGCEEAFADATAEYFIDPCKLKNERPLQYNWFATSPDSPAPGSNLCK